ncbi:MAG: hypothetical protein AB7L13_10365 [Acidimicrobiia bacterium]
MLIARAILQREPSAEITLVTGVAARPQWLADPRISVVTVPPLLKGDDGSYRHAHLPFEAALAERARCFEAVIEHVRPDAVLVDRHPFGTAGELRRGLATAKDLGASVVLGLRDIIDEPGAVALEFAGEGWADVDRVFDAVLVYGERWLCDHVEEYGLAVRPQYCGWVCEAVAPVPYDPRRIAVAAGGGADGSSVLRLGLGLLRARPWFRGSVVAGPYARDTVGLGSEIAERVSFVAPQDGCAALYAGVGAVIQMAGYNSTLEALAAGVRPILVPRRSPRREQAIRACRLAAVGLADVVDETADPEEVAWLLDRPRRFNPSTLIDAHVRLDGASRAADAISRLIKIGAS